MSKNRVVKAVVFDMDGLIIDSEPLWRKAEIDIFSSFGILLTEDLCRKTMGLRIDEVVDFWQARHPAVRLSESDVIEQIVLRMEELISSEGKQLPGVEESLDWLAGEGIPLAVATSSQYRLVDVVLDTFGIRERFQVIHSAEDEKNGKPDPAVYLSAARKLDIPPNNCLALEDSLHGIFSAKRAGMFCVAVPEVFPAEQEYVVAADFVIPSLLELEQRVFQVGRGLALSRDSSNLGSR